jgi:hypothetical protein
MKRLCLLLSLVALVVTGVPAQERLNITVPIAKPSTANCTLDYLTIDPEVPLSASRILVVLACNNGDVVQKVYDATTTPTGAALITTLNVSNNSTGTSLVRRVYNRLIADGVLAGTVSGTPQ